MNKRDILGFKRVIEYLDKHQTGAFGIKRLNKFQMMVLHYVGIGEGMEYECMENHEFEELIKVLEEETQNG